MNSERKRGTEDQGTRIREGKAGHQSLLRGNTQRPWSLGDVYTKLQWITKKAKSCPNHVFDNMVHLLTVDFLKDSFKQLRKNAAPGLDKVTYRKYAVNLDNNLMDLHKRLKECRYRATPVKRVWIDKEDNKKRPLGLPILEDKIVQRATLRILEAIYEEDFYNLSYGFRKGRNQHQALGELRRSFNQMKVKWVVDMDIQGCFDNIGHKHLLKFLEKRIQDQKLLRLIGKWLKVGVFEDGQLFKSEKGSPQGSTISPILANIFLHYVLDQWFMETVKPRLKGSGTMTRFADDSIVGFSHEQDARRVMEVLPRRFEKYGLTIHPKKTKLLRFICPKMGEQKDRKNGTFDFLGFTHYWGKTLKNYWVIKRRTARKKLRQKIKEVWSWCKKHRHYDIREQYKTLCSKLRGHYQYYGVRCNMRRMEEYHHHVRRAWKRWLGSRHRSGAIAWEKFDQMLDKYFVLPTPKIVHDI